MQQALEKQIIFQDHKEAYSLLGERDEFLQVMRENFDCQFISRGDRIEILGEAAMVEPAAKVLEELQYLYRQGTTITMHEVRYGIGLVKGGKGEALHTLFGDTILVTSRGRHVRPKTLGQRLYLDTIRHNSITFGIGPAGTGKTYLAVVMAVAALRNKEINKIILTRPAVEAGERLGFLPGDLQDKVDPYLRPLYDALQDILGQDAYQKLMAKGVIEIAPLAYMRGRTLEDAFIILDEAQNTTDKQMKMFLTRLGFGSRMVVTGDLGQVDLPRGVTSGLREAAEVLKDVKGVGIVRMAPMDVIRHEVVTRIVEAYGDWEAKKKKAKAKAEAERQGKA
ncbi:phosphate starvation-inducible protein PhoH [Selenomonas ruminantium]|uniref:PhoH-like protein n=1 Tax=Selenomonas ruminantium TaxID=971 RepID=A0A1I3CC13_SELRU|nr:PhoH family protein [Selenomonas ruminantium]MBQ1889186.1 PhoH family protein [Selenomonas sp.]SFH72094.1 phosphate starvation-inducible protein PhoH [Selenomonas ruminantium]